MTSTSSSTTRPSRRGSSTSTLLHLKQSQERITSRITELQSILSNTSTSIVKRQSAKVELAQLQKQVKHHSKRASVDALRGRTSQEGVVTKNRAILNKNIQLRIQHEEEIKLLQEQLAQFGIAAVERRMLEEELKKVQCELNKLNKEEELEERVNNSYSVAYDSIGYGSIEGGEEEESLYEEEYVPPVSIKVNHGQSKRISALETEEVDEPSGDTATMGIEEMLLAKESEEDEAELMRRISLEGINGGGDNENALTRSGLMDQWHQTYGANSMAELLELEENDNGGDKRGESDIGGRGEKGDQWHGNRDTQDEIVLVVPTKTSDGTGSATQPYRRRVTKENLQKRNLSIEMVEDQIRQYSNERMKELEGLNEDEFLNVLMARQANVAGLIGISDDELSIGHDINDLGGEGEDLIKGDDTLLTDDSTDSTQGDNDNNAGLESDLARLQSLSADPDDYILPSGGGGGPSDYQFEEQLRLAHEAIDAIEALDKERAQERSNLDVMMEDHEVNSGKRMQSLEVYVAKLEMAMLQHEDGQEEMAMKLTQVLGDKIKALDQHIVNLVGDPSEEDKSILYWKNKAARLEAKCFALEGDLEECDMTIQDLKEWKRIQEERIASIQKEKAASNSKPPRRPTVQEEKQELKRKLTVEDMQTAKLKAELDVLKAMKAQFDESDKDEQLRMLTQEIMKLISDKEDALEQAEKVKKVYEKSLSSKGPMDKSRRRLSSCAAMDPSFSAQLRRASMSGDINQQMKETAKIEMMALEERLKLIDGEKGELMKELETMKALLAAADGEKPGKKTERLVYQLSCQKCNKHMNFVGTTHTDLKTTMERHFAEVVKVTKAKRKSMKSSNGSVTTTDSSTKGKHEQWSEEFALHFANHVSRRSMFKTIAEKDVIAYCRENVKVEVLRRSDGAELYWEDTE